MIATTAAFATAAVLLVIFAVLSVMGALKKPPNHIGDIVARAIGATIVFAIPIGIAFPVGVIASALLIGVGAPPLTYVFLLLLALMTFRTAVKHRSDGMEGCTKMFLLLWSGYAIAWCIVSFEATGGLATLQADAMSLRWLQPPLAALPFALIVLKLAGKKRNLWLFLGTMAFVSAVMSLSFFPVENGFASGLLPESDWLRFPLTGLAIAAVLALVRLFFHSRLKPNIRRSRRRDLKSGILFVSLVMIGFGLAWAAARAVIAALA